MVQFVIAWEHVGVLQHMPRRIFCPEHKPYTAIVELRNIYGREALEITGCLDPATRNNMREIAVSSADIWHRHESE